MNLAMLAERPPWLVRLIGHNGRPVGAGIAIDNQVIATCAHVVAAALSGGAEIEPPNDSAPRPVEPIPLEFQFLEETKAVAVVVENGWYPVEVDGSGDLAILRLIDEAPTGLVPAPLQAPVRLTGEQVSMRGFPRGQRWGSVGLGFLGGREGPGGRWVQVNSTTNVGWQIESGYSGGPVWSDRYQAVVGMIVGKDAYRTGHILPLDYLSELWPSLKERMGWRLDIDPDFLSHWWPRGRGVEPGNVGDGSFFTGRSAALHRVTDWLKHPILGEPRILTVVGGPGSGKSALLAHLLIATDQGLTASITGGSRDWPVGSIDLAIHAKGMTAEEFMKRLALLTGTHLESPSQIGQALRERGTNCTILIDALDEASSLDEAHRIAVVIRELTSWDDGPFIRAIVGVRTAPRGALRPLPAAFGTQVIEINLDLDGDRNGYLEKNDVVKFAIRRLRASKGTGNAYAHTTDVTG
jgi:hypothetical protein